MNKQKGYTLSELLVVLIFFGVIAVVGGIGYHFIHKFW